MRAGVGGRSWGRLRYHSRKEDQAWHAVRGQHAGNRQAGSGQAGSGQAGSKQTGGEQTEGAESGWNLEGALV